VTGGRSNVRSRRRRGPGPAAAIAFGLLAGGVLPAAAQQIPEVTGPVPRVELPPPLEMSPGGAFWRALLVPGWGHAAIGSYTRGGFYVAAQTASFYTLFRARARIGEAQERVAFREGLLRRELAREGVTDPDEIDARLAADDQLSELLVLKKSRKEQQEDMLAFSIFLVLISSADAYVSAHLARFPEPLELEASPSPTGGLDVGLKVSVPNH
jgi:hypothetical protein